MNILEYYSPYFPYILVPFIFVGLYFHFEKYFTKPQMRWLWWVCVVLIVAAIGWYAGYNQGWFDFFKGYYHAGRKIFRNPAVLYDEYCYGYVNFPLMAYLFAPFGNLPKEVAGTIFFVIGYVSLIPLGYWLIKLSNLNGWKRWLVLAILALSGPLDYSIKMGNTTHMIMLIILISLLCLQRGREWLAGILLGVTGLIKIPLIFPAGYFLFRRRWRIVGGGILIVSLTILVSLKVIPPSLNHQWLESCILANAGKPMAAFNNQSVTGVLAREIIMGSQFFNWIPEIPTPDFQIISRAVIGLLLLPVALIVLKNWRLPNSLNGNTLEFFIILTCSLLISPISWTHYFMLLVIPTAFYLGGEFEYERHTWQTILLGISLVFISVPIGLTVALFEQTNQSLFLSIHFIGGLLFYIVLLSVWFQRNFFEQQELLFIQ